MKNLKQQLIRLGSQRPSLRSHLRPILDKLSYSHSQRMSTKLKEFKTPEEQELLNRFKMEAETRIQSLGHDFTIGRHNRRFIAFHVYGEDSTVALAFFKIAEDGSVHITKPRQDSKEIVNFTGDIEETFLDGLDRLEDVAKDEAVRRAEQYAMEKEKKLKNEKLDELKKDLKRWMKRTTDENYINEPYFGRERSTLSGSYRTWSINKEWDMQDRDNIKRVLKEDEESLKRHLSYFDDMIKSIGLGLGDKNYVEVYIRLKD